MAGDWETGDAESMKARAETAPSAGTLARAEMWARKGMDLRGSEVLLLVAEIDRLRTGYAALLAIIEERNTHARLDRV